MRLTRPARARSFRRYYLQIPTLLEFADTTFQRNHCFLLRGVDESSGQSRIRVDFQPWSKIGTPDVAGSVFLDGTSYRLMSSDIRLTKTPSNFQILGANAVTNFRDVVPGLPTVAQIVATSDLKKLSGPKAFEAFVKATERQTTLQVRFLNVAPGDSINGTPP